MKKLIALFIALALVCSLAACGSDQQAENNPTPQTATPAAENPAESTPNSETEENGKVLVACFSATGNTLTLAEYIADEFDADLYEIVPETPYTAADLDWNDSSSRTTVEMNDPDSRPAISGSVENMDDYTVVFLGYPIWWSNAPRIISTFLESYDFSGKTIIPFCTSGGSGIGSSAANLHDLTTDATWLAGSRFSAGTSRETIVDWVNGLEPDLNVTAE